MKKITKRQINKELKRRDSLRRSYILRTESGPIRNRSWIFENAYVYVEDGDITIYDYGYGEAKERKVIYPPDNAESFEITNIIKIWLAWDSTTSRQDVVDYIYRMINDLER